METSTIDRLQVVRVAEVMNENVITVHESDTMQTAARQIQSASVSGAPVTDQYGHCVGVISMADFVQPQSCSEPSANGSWCEVVHAHMSSPAVSISPTASLVHASELMCKKHVHRLPVVDETGMLIGMISSLDVVASLVSESNE